MLAKPTLATLLAVTVAMSVATGSVAGQSAEQFSASVFAHEAAGQYGWVYANLFPAQQKAISRTRYVTCSETRRRLTKQYLGIDFKSARLLKAPLPPKAVTAAVPGTHTTVRAVLVRWQV